MTATPHFPRIPGFELSDAAPTLATEWPRPAGDFPDALWPVTSLRRVPPEPTGWLIVEEHFHRDDMYGGTHSVLARLGAQDRVFRSTAWSGHHSIGNIELWNDGRFTDGLTTGDDPAAPDLRFFSQVREHRRLLIPTVEVTPPFLWYWDAFPSSDGWSYLNAAGRDLGGSKAPAARDRLGIAGLAPWPAFVEVVQRLTVGLERISALVAAANSEP